MSSHPPSLSRPPAPVPNTEVKTVISAKRGPEEEVQFVSVQPVKKCRGSRESPPTQQTQKASGPINTHPQDHRPSESRAFNNTPNTISGGPPPGEPQPDPGSLSHKVSLPNMENYVFPPPQNAPPGRASHSSPTLSPRQLPPPQLSTQNQSPGHGLPGVLAAPVFNSPMPPREFHVPWGMSNLYPQPGPMNTALSLHRPLLLPPIQPQRLEPPPPDMQSYEQPQTRPAVPRMPEPPQTLPAVSQQEHQGMSYAEQGRMSQTMGPGPGQRPPEPTRTSESHEPQAPHPQARTVSQAPSQLEHHAVTQAQNPAPTPAFTQSRPHPHPQSSTTGNSSVAASSQPPAAQPPCMICEQMRQHALFNQANGFPVVHPSHMQHGWHGQGPVPQQMHMVHQPQMGGGFGMRQHMPHTFSPRYQQVAGSQVPMGYVLPQGSFQVPLQMQMQRPVPVTNAPGTAVVVEHSASARQNQDNQGQQQTAAGQLLHFTAGVPQPTHPQYIPGQVSAHRPAMVVQPQAQAPPPPAPITPSPAAHSTAQPAQAPIQQQPPRTASPNLIVDIAETCEDRFPWEEVAKRHGVPRNKVVETFSAIIQLPLLRCTTDRKRHGKLATSRLREYTKAKKDVEAANAAAASGMTRPATPAASPTSAPAVNPFPNNQDRPVLPGVLEMASTMAPLGLPSTLTNGLTGPWQR